jgi:hypothetical protein
MHPLERKWVHAELSNNHSEPNRSLGDALNRFTLNIPPIATQSLEGEEVNEITAGDKSIGFRLSSPASPCASLCDC